MGKQRLNAGGLVMEDPNEAGLNQQYLEKRRLQLEDQEAARRRQAELDEHLKNYADDPVSQALGAAEFSLKEEEAQNKRRQKEYEKIVSEHDDPIMQTWAIGNHFMKQTDAPDAQRAFADRERLEQLKEQDRTVRKLDRIGMGNAAVRETLGSAVQAGSGIAAVVARLTGEKEAADALYRESQQFGQAREEARQDDLFPYLSRMYGGASGSLLQMAATPGGAASKIIGAGVMSGSEALTTAEDAGLQGADRLRYAGTQGLLEAGIAALGQKLFGAGVESRLAGQSVAAATWKQLAKNIGTDALKEMPEEVVTTILQDLSSKYENVSPDMTFGDFVSNSIDSAVQSAMMAGMGNAPNAASLALRKRPVQSTADGNRVFPEPVDVTATAPPAAAPEPAVPPVSQAEKEFALKPSAKNYEAAVNAGMPALENPNRDGRNSLAKEIRKRMARKGVTLSLDDPAADPSSQTPAPLEPTAPMETPSGTVPETTVDDVFNLLQSGDQINGQETNIKEQLQGSQGNAEAGEDGTRQEGRQEGRQELLTEPSAGTQDPATPAESQQTMPAPQTREEFEKEYRDTFAKMMQYSPDQAGSRIYVEKMADLYDSNPEWADEIESTLPRSNTTPSPSGPGEASPDQPVSPAADPVSEPKPELVVRHVQGKPADAKQHLSSLIEGTHTPVPDRDGLVYSIQPFDPSGKPEFGYRAYVKDSKATPGKGPLGWMDVPQVVERGETPDEAFQNALKKFDEKTGKIATPSPEAAPAAESQPVTPVPEFTALPQKSQDLFNKAFESKDVASLKQMVEKNNKAWNAEFQNRTGIKLPKTVKARHQAVQEWAAKATPAPLAAPEPDEQTQSVAQRTRDKILKAVRPMISEYDSEETIKAAFRKATRQVYDKERKGSDKDWYEPGTINDFAEKVFKTWKKGQPRPDYPPAKNSLRSIVMSEGGINSKSLGDDYNHVDLKANGLLSVMRKEGGLSLDVMAQRLESSGDLRTPSDRNPADWLMEQLQNNADGAKAQYTDKEIEAQLEKEREEYERLKETLQAEGIDVAGLEELRKNSIEAGFNEGEEISDEKAEELIDISFDFGANVKSKPAAPAAESDDFKLERPKAPKKKPEDFGTNPNSKQGGLFDAGKPGDLPGQELLFNSDPGDLNNPKTQENKAKADKSLYEMLKEVEQAIDEQGRVVDDRLLKRKEELERLILEESKQSETSPAQPQDSVDTDIEAAMRAELDRLEAEEAAAQQKPAKTRAPRTPKTKATPAEKKPRTKTGEKLAEKSKKTGEARKKAVEDFLSEMRGLGLNSALGPINKQALMATAKMVRAFIADGTVKFADFVMQFAEDTSPEIARKFSDYLEAAWKISGERNPNLDPAGKVADVLGPESEVKDGSGTPDATGREENQGEGEGDRRNGEDSTGPADAEVLAGTPSKDGRKTKKTRNSSSVRDSAGGKLRSGNGETDSAGVDGTERGGIESGRDTADDTGEGRGQGRDRAPQSTRPNYHLTNPEAIIGGGLKTKFERNRKAIEIVRRIEEDNRTPTAEELDTLAGYMGWGAFGQELFNGTWQNARPKEGWEEQDEWLRTYLGEEEWKSAQNSIINAHFTDPQTVTAMWEMIRRMGFNGGRVLEPSMGVGNFFSLMPRDLMERSTLTGIELDKITAKMAKLLHPNANIQQKGYQESQTPDNFYDLIVSNVPFGDIDIPDRRYKQDFSIHNYFFKKAFDQVKPGGVVAFLTSNMTMDGKVQAKLMRAQIMKQGGELVTAVRLPSGAFQAYAGTKVVADLIVIRKRKPGEQPSGDQNWIQVNEIETSAGKGKEIEVNEYWQNNPDHILGEMTWGHGTTTGRPGMVVNQPADLQASLNSILKTVPENIINTEQAKSEGRERANTTSRRQNSVLAESGDLWTVKGEHLIPLIDVVAWYRKGSKQATIDKNRKEIEKLLDVREALREVLDKQAASEDAESARAELNRIYDAFVKEFGPIGTAAAAKHLRKAGDPMGNTLLALESVSGLNKKTYTKRPIFSRATVRQKRNIENPTLNDAFALERNRSLDLDMERIAKAAKLPVEKVIEQLVADGRIYKTGHGTYDAADVFLSGNMARKLRQLESAQAEGMEGLERSIEAVRSRIPAPVPYSQIEAKFGATWITSDDYANYIGSLLNEPGSQISVERRIQGWKVTIPTNINQKPEATTMHGHPGVDFSRLVSAAMNNATVRVTMPDPEDSSKKITDPEATAAANEKLSELRENFSSWLWSDAERIARLSSAYNEEFNSTVTPEFDDVPLDFEGLALERGDQPFNLRHHQASAVWRGIVSGKGIFAHEVGTGKTLTMAALAMENRRLGLASKPILLAHNANSLAVRNEIQEAYPGANILYVDNLDAANKDATLQSIATEDWDLIVVPHSMAERFQLRPETVEALLKPEMDALEAAAIEAFQESESTDYAKGVMPGDLDNIEKEDLEALREPTAKELVKERMKLRAQIVKAQQAMAEGKGIFFEDMGIDMVMVDEAHLFKKLPITSKQRIKGLNKSASQMGNMLMMMTDYIRTNNNGRGVYLFTGTPITNTINEIFNMMRFVMAEEMEVSGVRSWDGWFNNFATQDTLTELSSGGTWENFDRLASFVNLPELRQMAGQYMDIVFADDMPEFKPRDSREGRTENPVGRPFKQVHNVIIDMIDAQREHSANLAARYTAFKEATGKEKVRMMREPGGQFNPLVIEGEGVKLAMDPRLTGFGTKDVDGKLLTDETRLDPRNPNLKINKMIRNAMTHYHEHPKATQMVFMQVGYTDTVKRVIGHDDAGDPIKATFPVFNLAKEIKRRLIEEGVPESEIAIFSGMTKEKRAEAALQMQQGIIRFAIGSTETMGTGVNAQNELIAMHHLDAPWMPGDLEQRNGRGHRQGNRWNTVNEYRYLTEGPQDGRRWQVLLTKDRFIKEFMRGDAMARVIEMDDVDLSEDGEGTDMEQTFSAAAGDPRIMQRIRLEGQVEKLQRQKNSYAQSITDTAQKASKKKREINDKTAAIDSLTSLYETWKANRTEEPEATINGKKYVGAKDITFELQQLAERYDNKMHDGKEIGEYRGIPLYAINGELYIGKPSTLDSLQVWKLGTDANNTGIVTARWNYQSLQGIMSNLPERIAKQKESIQKDQQFIDMAQKAANEPFPKQKQLDSKQKRLQALVTEMSNNPNVSPAWLRSGAPIGTAVYRNGEKFEVAGHRGNDTVLYTDGDDLKPLPAAELTDAEGTPLFPDLPKPEAPAATQDPATPAADDSELRQAAERAKQELREIQALNAQYDSVIAKEWKRVVWGQGQGTGFALTDEMTRAIAGRILGSIKAGVKQFEVLVRELRANVAEDAVRGLKPNLIRTWNALRVKHGLDEATEAGFNAAMSDTDNVDMEQAIAAVKGEPSTPPADPATQPAVTPDPATGDERLYSTQNAFSAVERENLGMEERTPVPTLPRAPSVQMAAAIGRTKEGAERIDDLIAELTARPRSVTPLENDLLNYRNAELGEKLESTLRQQIEAHKAGDDALEKLAEVRAREIRTQKKALIELVLEPIGTEAGRNLQARKAVINQDFTLERMALEYEAAFGQKPSTAQLAEFQKQIDDLTAAQNALEKLIAEQDAKISELETRLKDAHDTAVNSIAPEKSKTSSAKKRAQEKVSEKWKNLAGVFGKLYSIETATANTLSAFAELAGAYVELGVVSLGDFLSRVKKRMGPDAEKFIPQFTQGWNDFQDSINKDELSRITNTIDPDDADTIGRAARDLHRFVIRRDNLDASAAGREAAVDAVHTILATYVPGITPDQTARAMSGIGVYSELSKDEIEVIRRDQKAQLLSLQQISDWKKGQAPPATGVERPPVSDEQRALRKAVNEAKKAAGIVTTTPGQLRSALDAAKRMAKNRISDLAKAIETGKRIAVSRKLLVPDAELLKLQATRDALQQLYNEAFGKRELSDEQRLNMAEKALDRAISDLENDLKTGKLYDDSPKKRLTSPALEVKRATLAALKANRDEMRMQSGEAQARSDAAYERRLLERDAELARRLAAGDFKTATKKQARQFTPEMLKLMQSIEKKRQELRKQAKAWEFENRHPVYKAIVNGPRAAAHVIRKGLTTIDQSLIGRQGLLLGITHPFIYGKAIRNAFASNPLQAKSIFPTEQDLFNTQAALDADPNWVQLEKIGKLAVTDVHGGIKREEGNEFAPEWIDKYVPGVAGSERAGSAFINTQRRLVFRSLVEKLATQLDGQRSVSNAELRVIGNLVNVSTGRATFGRFENAVEAATLLFFSPRWWASRLQWITGAPIWKESQWFGGEGASSEVRKMVATEMIKQAGAQMAIMGVVVAGLMAAYGDPGDDEEWNWHVDPRHVDFGKLRIGQTLIDMTAGLGQHVSLIARMLGTEVRRWEGASDTKRGTVLLTYGRGKLAPIPGMIADFLSDNGRSMSGEKAGSGAWFVDKLAPLIMQDVLKTTTEEGIPAGPVLSMLMFFGIGAQTRDERLKERGDFANELRAARKQGKSPEKIQELLNEHLRNAAETEAKTKMRVADPEDLPALQKVVSGQDSPELTEAIQKEKQDIALAAIEMLSTEDRMHKKAASEDSAIKTARSILQEIAPTYEEANALFTAAYKKRHGRLVEMSGGQFAPKKSVIAARRRLRIIYGK